MPGEKIGQYEITEHLGRGGMADVYKAIHPGLSVNRAIKVIRPELVTSDDFRVRFKKEAHTVAELRHPNIVQVHDFGLQDDSFYMVMEFVEGKNLKQLLEAEGRIRPIERALKIVSQVAAALEYAHEHDLVHRDIKPDNIMLREEDGSAVLMDFGIAKLLTADTQLTQKGLGIGTPAYIAPEQATAQADIGPAADIYSLSIVLYEMLTGQVPFVADTPMAVILQAINEPLHPPREVCPEISEELEQVIFKGTAKNPAERFSSAGEFRTALERLLREEDQNATYVRPVPVGGAKPAAAVRGARIKAISITVAAAIALAVGGSVLLNLRSEDVTSGDVAANAGQISAGPVVQGSAMPVQPTAVVFSDSAKFRVAVQPFTIVGEFPDGLNHLGRSLANENRYSLRRLTGLPLVYRGAGLAREQTVLPVSAALRGNIQLRDGAWQLSAFLEGTDGVKLWSQDYDFSIETAYATQRTISQAVAEALGAISTTAIEIEPFTEAELPAIAYEQFLRGSILIQQRGARPMDASIQLFRNTLDAQPEFARAHLAMAYVYATFPYYANREEPDAFRLAETALARALEHDPGLTAEITGIQAYISLRRWQWPQANELFDQALQQDANSAETLGFYAQFLASTGDVEGAVAHARKAWDLDAHSPVVHAQLAVSLLWQGAIAEAARQFQIGDELGLQDQDSQGKLLLLVLQRREADTVLALSQLHRASSLPDEWVVRVVQGLFDPQSRAQAVAAFASAIREDSVLPSLQWPIWVLLENQDQAFATFERFAAARQYRYLDVEFLSSPETREFRADPRYAALANRYGLPLEPAGS